ncbi:MAG TPA: ATP synthase subunit I [Gemmata sp.]|nr:ATP synthase subunit I [Gemmata sp.]
MNWATAAITGFGLGLAYFSGLWLGINRLQRGGAARFAAGTATRLVLAAVVFYALLRTGGARAAFVALAGLLAARCYLVRVIGRTVDGR